MRDENSIRYFMENETLIHNVIPFLKEQEMLALMCVNKRVCTAVHSAPHLPYLSTPFLSKMLSEHKAPVRVYVDNYNCFMTKNDDVTVSYRHAFNTPCVPPYMPIRKNISVLNIPIHHDYNIDLSTFPHLTKLVVTVFSQPHQDLPPLVLKSFHVHLSSANDIPSLNRMTKVISPTTVYLRSPRSYNIAEIKAIMPGAVVVTPKLYDISQLSKVHYVLDSIQIETKTVSCFSLHAEMAFDNNNDFIKQRMIQSACVYGSLKSIPTTPLRFTDIILFGVTLPSSGQLSFVGAKNLSVYKCSNISTLHFDKCDLQSLTFSRNSCLSCFRIPSTITSLDASQWKPVTIPNFKFLRNLCLSNCPTFRHLSIPFSVTSLTLKNCEKIRKISTQNLILQKMELENVGELKSLYFPTTLVDLTLDSVALPVCDCSSLLKLTKLVVSNCPKLTKITITNEISSLEISSCELLTSFVLPQLRINDLLISACTSLKMLTVNAEKCHFNYLPNIQELSVVNNFWLTSVQCSKLPVFEKHLYNVVDIKNNTIDKMDVDVLALSLQNVHVGTEFTLPTTVTALTLVKVSNLTQIAIPEATQRLMLKGVEMSKLVVPHNVGFLSLKNLKLTALEIPEKCTELRIGGMPLQSVSYPSGITRLKAKKKILKLFNAEHLPLVPKEIFEERN